MPQNIKTPFNYFEPFVGAGALLFELTPKNAQISDLNEELINVYKCIKSPKSFGILIKLLDTHQNNHSEEHYYKTRGEDKEPTYGNLTKEQKAARAIYLNKTCFNGLYRVNSNGKFNVPSSKKEIVKTYDGDNMNLLHQYLLNEKVSIRCADFAKAVMKAKRGDFVYFDPPYDQETKNSFVSYTKYNFDQDEHQRLFRTILKLHNKGVYVMLSNSNTKFIRELYSDKTIFNVYEIEVRRMINSKSSGRTITNELIITTY